MALSIAFNPKSQLEWVLRTPCDETKELFLENLEKHIKRNQELFVKRLMSEILGCTGVDFKEELGGVISKMLLLDYNRPLTDSEKKHIVCAFYSILGNNFYDMFNCTEKEKLQMMYPIGTRLKLIKALDDMYSPKNVGDVLTVKYIDDMANIHGSWDSGGSIALISGVDSFEIVSD